MSAPSVDEILEKLGPITQEKVFIEDRTFLISRPAESDRLIELPAVHNAFARDEYMPYWADLWPAARMLAKVILREDWPAGQEVLEIGCGLGLAGLVALTKGCKVTFSDYDPCALKFAADNARLNGFENFRTLPLDWREPPPGLSARLLLGSDLIYEMRYVEPLVHFIKRVLEPGGVCLLTDQDRIPAQAFQQCLAQEMLPYTTQIVRAGEPGGRRHKGTLYRITR